jgi:hypothetical protein
VICSSVWVSATDQIRAEETVKYEERLKGYLEKIAQGEGKLGKINYEIRVRSAALTQWISALQLQG